MKLYCCCYLKDNKNTWFYDKIDQMPSQQYRYFTKLLRAFTGATPAEQNFYAFLSILGKDFTKVKWTMVNIDGNNFRTIPKDDTIRITGQFENQTICEFQFLVENCLISEIQYYEQEDKRCRLFRTK